MKRYTLAAVLAAFIAVLVPSSAFAWHGELTCTQLHWVGTPTHLEWSQNGQVYLTEDLTGAWEQIVPTPWPRGYGKITVVASWFEGRRKRSQTLTTSVPCGQKPPEPTPTPTPTPTPPPEAPPAPPVTPPTVATPAPTPPPPAKKVCAKPKKSRFRMTDTPNMSTLPHGRVTFLVRGPHIRWVRWHFPTTGKAITDRSKPFKLNVWLWDTSFWGPALYGRHQVKATVRTKCGTVHLSKSEFNHDPPVR